MLLKYFDKNKTEAGVDEAGRGCLAGPVFAAAVILPKDFEHPLLNDSKKMSEVNREILREIIEKEAVAWAVGRVDAPEIDKINILQASFKAMHLAIAQLNPKPDLLLIDGNRFAAYESIPQHCIIKGDGIYASIAAASVLAKTHRDEFMKKLHKKLPMYGWANNKAYATASHIAAIKKYGHSKFHRKSFIIKPRQLKLEF